MEETKRRRFIIRAVLEGEVDVQDAPVPQWDYVWNTSSGVLPEGMTYRTYNFTTEPGVLCVREPNLDFDTLGDCEIEVEMKCYASSTSPAANAPQIAVMDENNNGFKVYAFSPINYKTNISGSSVDTGIVSDEDYHVFTLTQSNGQYRLKIDGVEQTGPGVTNSQYLYHTGIYTASLARDLGAFFKSIKFRRL